MHNPFTPPHRLVPEREALPQEDRDPVEAIIRLKGRLDRAKTHKLEGLMVSTTDLDALLRHMTALHYQHLALQVANRLRVN